MNFRWQICLAVLFTGTYALNQSHSDSKQKTEFCLADEEHPYPYYATRSSYDNVRCKNQYHSIPGCTPIKLWMVIRHASRYPGKNKIEDLKQLLSELQDQIVENFEKDANGAGGMCQKDFQNIKNWSFSFTDDLGNKITQEGLNDLKNLAARLKNMFPHLLNLSYTPRLFQFKTSAESQSMESAEAFVRDLFNLSSTKQKIPTVSRDQNLLHPQMVCSKWVEMVNSPEMTREEALFIASDTVQKMIADISKRLGYKKNITYSDVKNMYAMCRYENVCYGNLKTPFCAAFTPNDLEIMEFTEDVHRYYQDGHGNYVDKKLGCPLVKDMVEKFSEPNDETAVDSPVSIFFGHSGTVIQLVTALGFKKDQQPLRHDNYKNMTDRQWKMSFIAPFNANFLAVLYDCKNNGKQVQFFLNEWPVVYPECDNVTGLCQFDDVQKRFDHFIDTQTCNLDFCDVPEKVYSDKTVNFSIKWFAVIVLTLIFFYLLIFRVSKIKWLSNIFGDCCKSKEYSRLD